MNMQAPPKMRVISVTDLEALMAAVGTPNAGPVFVNDGDKNVSVVMSVEEYKEMQDTLHELKLKALHKKSMQRFGRVYEALAK